MFTYTTPFEANQCPREGPAKVFSGANILFPPATSSDIFEWIQLQKELERREAAKQRELRKPRVVKKIESEDAYQLQIFKEYGDFNSYEVEAKKKPGNRVHLTISSKDDQFSKTFEFSLNEIEVSKVDWEWYKKENVLVLNIPKKQQIEYTFYSHPLFGLIQQQPEREQAHSEQERREVAHKKALEYRKRAEHAREKAQRKRAEAEERKRLEAQEKKRIEERRRAEAEERRRVEAVRRAEAEEKRRVEAARRAELEAAKKAKEEAQRRARIEAEQRKREQQEQAAAFAAIRELQRQAFVQLQQEAERKAQIEKERQEAERKEEERLAKIERERFDYREAQRQAHRRQQQEEAERKSEQEARKTAPQAQNVQLDPSNPEVFLQQLFGSILAANQSSSNADSSQVPAKPSSTESPVSSSAATPDYDDSDNESIYSDRDPETPEPLSPSVPPSSPGLKLTKQPSLEEVEDEEFVMFRKKFGQK
ncbi:hypothetical protein CLIB1423_01S07206 [[Candida] railenensis]|uniref:Uncharacterized protein n=1 Tax=[Candida] railenensis TaxID=45579 RepID=A0A9P0VVR2_9ASCO|nr:hypothetical protein CLIB1423_01S07206 [[Candida] railenensis]